MWLCLDVGVVPPFIHFLSPFHLLHSWSLSALLVFSSSYFLLPSLDDFLLCILHFGCSSSFCTFNMHILFCFPPFSTFFPISSDSPFVRPSFPSVFGCIAGVPVADACLPGFWGAAGVCNDHGKTYALYAITVYRRNQDGSEECWKTYRRYSDFHDFHMRITEQVPAAPRASARPPFAPP